MKPDEAQRRRKAAQARAAGGEDGFNADARAEAREKAPIVIGGVTFTRRRKVWAINLAMRDLMRDQEKSLAKANRIKTRVAEHEVNQIEAATDGESELEDELEAKIDALIEAADDSTRTAEVATYRLLALLLIPPATAEGEEPLVGFGPDAAENDEDAVLQAIGWLQEHLDVEEAAGLGNELTGAREADPTTTPSSETGST